MDFNQALQIVSAKNDDLECVEALDMGEFWAFAFGKKDEPMGGGYTTVSKNAGIIGSFNPTQDLKLFRKAKPIVI